MSQLRSNSQRSFKPIPEDKATVHHQKQAPHHLGSRLPDPPTGDSIEPVLPRAPHSSPALDGSSTPEAQIQELRKLLTEWQDDEVAGGGRGGVSASVGASGSRPSSRCSLRSSSRQGSRFGSRRNSWVASEDEDDEPQVTSSQKAHLLVASQQRLLYTLQGLRHELSSMDEEVNRVRNDMLNSRRYFNAMRGLQEQATWGSGYRRNAATCYIGSGSSSPSMYSLDNSYSDDTDSLARSESCSSFASWRSEAELFNVFREAEDVAAADKTSDKSSISNNHRSDTSNSNDTSSNNSGCSNSQGSSSTHKDSGSNSGNNSGVPVIRGRYRQLGASHLTPRR